jgi:hypothetical protein
MYGAKSAGKNRYQLAGEMAPPARAAARLDAA